jgi:transposase
MLKEPPEKCSLVELLAIYSRKEEVAILLRGADVNEIQEYQRQGLSISQIAALTGFNRRTVRKYLVQPQTPRYRPRPPRPSQLDPHQAYLQQRLQAGVWNARVLLRELQARGYSGGYTILKDYLQPLRQAAQAVAVRRFETPPGHQAQVDWGDLGTLAVGDQRRSLSGFVFTLGHSRAMFAEVALDQRLPTLLRLHEAAFAALGGIPREILYDHMKTVVLGTDERGEVAWQPLFREFAAHWGFIPRLCRPYRPQTKGKVESGIGYVRKSFLCGCQAADLPELRAQLAGWLTGVANQRVHGTTHQVVAEAWAAEQAHLQPLAGRPPFPLLGGPLRRVGRDAYVTYQANRYSVPWSAAGQEVEVREGDGQVEIWREGQRLAVHPRCTGRYQVSTIAAHHRGMPWGPLGRPGKRRITLNGAAPQVEVRSLSVYEAVAAAAGGRA